MNDDAHREHPDSAVRLPARETEAVIAQVVGAHAASLPLPTALRAASEVVQHRDVRLALASIATRVEQGERLDQALAAVAPQVPAHLAELLRLAAHDEQGSALLTEFIEDQRRARRARRDIRQALMYPSLLLLLTAFVNVFVPAVLMDQLMEVYREMELAVPRSVLVTAWVGKWGPPFFCVLILTFVVLILVARFGLGRARCNSLLTLVPLVGPIWHWLELGSTFRALKLLLAAGAPMPDALRRSANGSGDERIAGALRRSATRVESGESAARALAFENLLPESLLTFLVNGERHRALPQALDGVARICDERARQRGRWFRVVLPAVVFIMVGYSVTFCYGNVLRPMVSLIGKLQ